MAPANAKFVSVNGDAHMAQLFEGARALVFPGEEDFGIMPVEAMAAGCPVIAFGRGGALKAAARPPRWPRSTSCTACSRCCR